MISEIVFVNGRLKFEGYQEMYDALLPFVTKIENKKWIFQRDDYAATTKKKWFQNFEIELLPWLALSGDLNPIEKLGGILAKKAYDPEKPLVENIVEIKKKKIRVGKYSKRNIN